MGLLAAGGAVLIAGTAFAAGLAVAGNRATLTTASAPIAGSGPNGGAPQGGLGGGAPQGGTGGAPRFPSGIGRLAAAGRISAVHGSTLTLESLGGGSVTVRTTGATQVEQDLGGSVSALQVGDVIFVAGTRAGDGTVTALAIADHPFFAGIGGGRGLGGNGQGGTGQSTGGTVLNG